MWRTVILCGVVLFEIASAQYGKKNKTAKPTKNPAHFELGSRALFCENPFLAISRAF